MKIVAAKCPNCGANIDVDANSDSTKCSYCNSKIIVDEAIEKLKIELSGHVEVLNLPKLSSYLKNGARNYKNKQYYEAYQQYTKALELEPDNYIALLRSCISKILSTNLIECDVFPLINAMKDSYELVKNTDNIQNINQIIIESCDALAVIVNNIVNYNNKALIRYKVLLGNQQKLYDCLKCYNTAVSFVKDNNNLKISIYKNVINVCNHLMSVKYYYTNSYKDGVEIIGKYIPNEDFNKLLRNIRRSTTMELNKLEQQS